MSSEEIANTQQRLWTYVAVARPQIEDALERHLPSAAAQVRTNFNAALRYALFPGGKRLRPVLTLLGAEIVGGAQAQVLSTAVAVEFVHTSSLIFDDLPCMDNAAERRGRSTLHSEFGEDTAILVALALLNAAYGLVLETPSVAPEYAIAAHRELVRCIGANGMVAGQSVDLAANHSEQRRTDNTARRERFETTRNLKTSALIRMALMTGALLCGADETQQIALAHYAELIGDAYQTSDDLLDLTEDAALTEKTSRAATIAQENSVSARARIERFSDEAKQILLRDFAETEATLALCGLADYVASRGQRDANARLVALS